MLMTLCREGVFSNRLQWSEEQSERTDFMLYGLNMPFVPKESSLGPACTIGGNMGRFTWAQVRRIEPRREEYDSQPISPLQ